MKLNFLGLSYLINLFSAAIFTTQENVEVAQC